MKRARMFGGNLPAPSEVFARGSEDLSRFVPKPESRIRLWTAAEKKIARLLDTICTGRETRTQSHINRRTSLFIETELARGGPGRCRTIGRGNRLPGAYARRGKPESSDHS